MGNFKTAPTLDLSHAVLGLAYKLWGLAWLTGNQLEGQQTFLTSLVNKDVGMLARL